MVYPPEDGHPSKY